MASASQAKSKPTRRPSYSDPQGLQRLLKQEEAEGTPSRWVEDYFLRWLSATQSLEARLTKAATQESNLSRALLLWRRNALLEQVVKALGYQPGRSYSAEECRLPWRANNAPPPVVQDLLRSGALTRSRRDGILSYKQRGRKSSPAGDALLEELPFQQCLYLTDGKDFTHLGKGFKSPQYFPPGQAAFVKTPYAWYYNPRASYREGPRLLAAHSLWGVYALAGLTNFYEERAWPVHPALAVRQAHDHLLHLPQEQVTAAASKPFSYNYCYGANGSHAST